jgi:hypothetical protein
MKKVYGNKRGRERHLPIEISSQHSSGSSERAPWYGRHAIACRFFFLLFLKRLNDKKRIRRNKKLSLLYEMANELLKKKSSSKKKERSN